MLSRRFLRIKVVKSLYSHLHTEDTPIAAATKNLTHSIDKAYQLYFQMLSLIPALAEYGRERIEIGLNKKLPTYEDLNPNRRFVESTVVALFERCDQLCDKTEREGLGWTAYPEVVRHLYDLLTEQDFYINYMNEPKASLRSEVRMLEDFFINCVQDNELVEQTLEEMSLLWVDDLDYILTMVLRTLRSLREGDEKVALLPQFKNSDDEKFAADLFTRAVVDYTDNIDYLEKYTRNWDMERIASMDLLLLSLAMTEITRFPSIPVKVSLDEYIEISRYYSTLGSPQFINGILDKAVADLTAEGRIVKTGRGLL